MHIFMDYIKRLEFNKKNSYRFVALTFHYLPYPRGLLEMTLACRALSSCSKYVHHAISDMTAFGICNGP